MTRSTNWVLTTTLGSLNILIWALIMLVIRPYSPMEASDVDPNQLEIMLRVAGTGFGVVLSVIIGAFAAGVFKFRSKSQ